MALENYDCLLGKQGRRLTKEETEHYVRIFHYPEDAAKIAVKGMIGDGHLPLGIMIQRLEQIGALNKLEWDQIITPTLAGFIAIVLDRPGMAVMWAFSLWKLYTKEKKTIDTGDWAFAWPMGLPTDEEAKEAWYSQKDPHPKPFDDNLIDHFENWPKLNPEAEPEADPVLAARPL